MGMEDGVGGTDYKFGYEEGKIGERGCRGCTMNRAALVSALRMPPITDCISNFYLLMSVTMDFNDCEYPCLSVFCYSYNFSGACIR